MIVKTLWVQITRRHCLWLGFVVISRGFGIAAALMPFPRQVQMWIICPGMLPVILFKVAPGKEPT